MSVSDTMAKALLINGSPKAAGCTYTALKEIADTLEKEGIGSEIVHVGYDVPGCRDCKSCKKTGRCVMDDLVNEVGARLDEFDAVVLGSSVYYASASGQVCAFADRLFYSHGKRMAGKVGAAVVSCRRGGASAAFDRLNKYFTICNMPIAPSQYWNQVHGNTPDEVRQDLEVGGADSQSGGGTALGVAHHAQDVKAVLYPVQLLLLTVQIAQQVT